jgi:para-nitrobenzyl esterase
VGKISTGSARIKALHFFSTMIGTVILLLLFRTTHSSTPAPTTVITLANNSTLQGGTNTHALFFLNIPYVNPPTGKDRWQPPSYPAIPWSGVRQATERGNTCMGPKVLNKKTASTGHEDCLTLNIYAPLETPDAPVPVVVFIPGGGYMAGNAWEDGVYNCSALAETTGMIYVVLQYRLGAFGFLAAPQINPDTKDADSISYLGIQDQQAALQWVQDNIHVFQGDKSQVTLWGQSAGGGSVLLHLAMESSWNLFHRCVVESPYLRPIGNASTNMERWQKALVQGKTLISTVGCGNSNNTVSVGECMRGTSAETINDALKVDQGMLFDTSNNWYPVFHNLTSSPDSSHSILRPNTSVLIGNNMNESNMLDMVEHVRLLFPISTEELEKLVVELWGEDKASVILQHYNHTIDGTNGKAFFAMVSDAAINCPIRTVAQRLCHSGSQVYQYVFDAAVLPEVGVAHASELPFVFDRDYMLPTKSLIELSKQMVGLWEHFEKTGNPNGGGLVPWKWPNAMGGAGSSKVVVFRTNNQSAVTLDPFNRCFVWSNDSDGEPST